MGTIIKYRNWCKPKALKVGIVCIVITLSCGGGIDPPSNPTPEEMIGWTNYSLEHVIVIAEAPNGDMWFIVDTRYYKKDDLLYQFNGNEWKLFTQQDILGISFSDSFLNFTCIACAGNKVCVGGIEYRGGIGGIFIYDGNNWRHYTTEDGLVSNYVRCVDFDSDGNLWIGTNGGISKFDGSTKWDTFTVEDGLPSNVVFAIKSTNNGKVVCCTEEGVAVYTGGSWSQYSSSEYWCLWKDHTGKVWVQESSGGFKVYDGYGWHKVEINGASHFPWDEHIIFAVDKNGGIWVASDEVRKGVVKYKDGTQKEFHSHSWWGMDSGEEGSGLGDEVVNTIFVDSKNNKWFGTYRWLSKYVLE